jgi:hypothetical protein
MNNHQLIGTLPFFSIGEINFKEFWKEILAFLNRDLRSFFPSSKGATNETAMSQGITSGQFQSSPPDPPVESLVDLDKLPYLAYRREVLDWRDTFHAKVTITVTKSLDSFVRHMDEELAEVSLFRSVFTRPADEVLESNFRRDIRMPLINVLQQEKAGLSAAAQKWANFASVDLAIDTSSLNPGCASLYGIGFKPANRNLIKSRMQDLLLGPAGIAEDLRDQGSHISRKLLENTQS